MAIESMSIAEQVEGRKACEDFVNNAKLKMPEEVAELFEAYTRWIWQYKCPGAIYKYYCDETTIYGANGSKGVGADASISSTLQMIQAFPDRVNEFVDIFVEGDPENGYSFGQTTCMNGINTGYSKYGPPTGKNLERNGEKVRSICECRVEKVDGRWRIIDEWVVGSSDAILETCTPDPEDGSELVIDFLAQNPLNV